MSHLSKLGSGLVNMAWDWDDGGEGVRQRGEEEDDDDDDEKEEVEEEEELGDRAVIGLCIASSK